MRCGRRSRARWAVRIPGIAIAVIDDDGNERRRAARPAKSRSIASRPTARPTRCSSSSTSRIPTARAQKFTGDWCRTGDVADARRRRLSLVPGPRRRHVQGRGLPDRAVGNRELPRQAPGGRQRGRGAVAGRDARQRRQGVHRARARARAVAGARGRHPRSMCASISRRTNIRRRSSSSTRCR